MEMTPNPESIRNIDMERVRFDTVDVLTGMINGFPSLETISLLTPTFEADMPDNTLNHIIHPLIITDLIWSQPTAFILAEWISKLSPTPCIRQFTWSYPYSRTGFTELEFMVHSLGSIVETCKIIFKGEIDYRGLFFQVQILHGQDLTKDIRSYLGSIQFDKPANVDFTRGFHNAGIL